MSLLAIISATFESSPGWELVTQQIMLSLLLKSLHPSLIRCPGSKDHVLVTN